MCTAVTYKTKGFYFGRTLDYEFSYGEEVTITPRNYCFVFRNGEIMNSHYAIIGMAHVEDIYPLYYDAINEKGLGMAGLNFVGNTKYQQIMDDCDNIAAFEFIPWILGQCENVQEAKQLLKKINLTKEAFSAKFPPAELHWIIADNNEAITVEAMESGIYVYDNPVGVLTNNPPFPMQMQHLNNFMHLSPGEPINQFSSELPLNAYSRGMGALGLPGDLSSQSRFVRASFVKMNACSEETEEESVNQFFHIMGSVEQQRGCCYLGNNEYEITIYTSCCSAEKGIYYYTTYENHQITAVDMYQEDLEGSLLIRYGLERKERIRRKNSRIE